MTCQNPDQVNILVQALSKQMNNWLMITQSSQKPNKYEHWQLFVYFAFYPLMHNVPKCSDTL